MSEETTTEKYKRILKEKGKDVARQQLGLESTTEGRKRVIKAKQKKAGKGKTKGLGAPPPTFTTSSGLNCWIRYTNSGARYTTCGTYHGSGPAPAPVKLTPLITPATFVGMMGKSGYNDLTEGQKKEYHRLVMANRRAEEREHSTENIPKYREYLREKKETQREERKEFALHKEQVREESKIKRAFLKKGAIARTEEDIKEYYETFQDRELKEAGFVRTKQKEQEKLKKEIDERRDRKLEGDVETEAIKEIMREIGEGGQYKPVFGERVRKLPKGATRELDAISVEAPWKVEYSLSDIIGDPQETSSAGTNLDLILQIALGEKQIKLVKGNVKDILKDAYDIVYNKHKDEKVKIKVKAETDEEKRDADNKGFVKKSVSFFSQNPIDSDELQEEFEDAMDEVWKKSVYGKDPDLATRFGKEVSEKIRELTLNKYKQNIEMNYQDELIDLEKNAGKKLSKEEKEIRAKYDTKISKSKHKLREAIQLAEDARIPISWIKKNVRIVFDEETGEPMEGDYLKTMVNKVGSAYHRVKKLDGTLEEIKEAVAATIEGRNKGTIFSRKFYRQLDADIARAEKEIRELEREEKIIQKFLKKQAWAQKKKFKPPPVSEEVKKQKKALAKLKKQTGLFGKK